MKTWIASAVVVAGLLIAGGCEVEVHHHHDREVVVERGPGERVVHIEGRPAPEPLREEITVRPRVEAVWVSGHWVRDHGYWVWERGHWD